MSDNGWIAIPRSSILETRLAAHAKRYKNIIYPTIKNAIDTTN